MNQSRDDETGSAAVSFYVTGGTLRLDSPSYVERRADKDLCHALLQGEFCYVLTSRQMGKSSLMIRTASRLREQVIGVLTVDLTEIGQNLTPEQWYYGLILRLGRQLRLEDELKGFWDANERLSPVQRLFTAIREVAMVKCAAPLVIFVDELDTVRSLPFSTDEFFAAIRECYSRRSEDAEFNRLTFCLLGVATPGDLIRDTRTTPFNIGTRIDLNDFTEREAWPLAKGLSSNEQIAEALLARILYWTNGHPYLTQRLCRAVSEAWPPVSDARAAGQRVDELCQNLFLSSSGRERDDNLLFVRERLLRSEVDRAALLDLYAQLHRWGRRVRHDEANPLVSILRLSGIVAVAGGYLRLRNRIYERVFDQPWIRANTPNAELLRQRAAFWRGALRSAGIGTAILLALAHLSLTALRQSRTAKSQADQARQLHETRLRLNVASGVESLKRGDSMEALLWFAEALRGDQENRERIKTHRLRIGSVLQQMPKIVQMWIQRSHILCGQFGTNSGQVLLPGPDGRARLWDVGTAQPISPPFGLGHHTETAFLSLDGQAVITADDTRVVRVWNTGTGEQTLAFTNSAEVSYAEFSPKRDRAVNAGWDGVAVVWNALTGEPLRRLPNNNSRALVYAGFDPAGARIVTASRDGRAVVWDVETGKIQTVLAGHGNWVYHAQFSPDGRSLATGSFDQTARIWDLETGLELFRAQHGDAVRSVGFSPDGQYLLTGSFDSEVRIWDIKSRKLKPPPLKDSGQVTRAVFSPDGRRILTVNWTGVARLWDLGLESSLPPPTDLIFSPDGSRCLVMTNGEVQVKHTLTLRTHTHFSATISIFSATNLPISAILFSRDGNRLVTFGQPSSESGLSNRVAQLWDAESGAPLGAAFEYEPQLDHTSLAPAGDRLATYGGGRVVVWDTRSGRRLCDIAVTNGTVEAVGFDPRAQRMVVTKGTSVQIWSLSTGRPVTPELPHAAPVTHAEFGPDGSLLVTTCRDATLDARAAQLWDAETGRQFGPPLPHRDGVHFATFSPDGRRVVTASEDFTAIIWDVQNGRQIAPALKHEHQVRFVSFSLDGRWIVTAGRDGAARIWDADTGEPVTLPFVQPGSDLARAQFVADGRRLLTVTVSDEKRLWDLPRDNRPVDDLVLIAELFSGQQQYHLGAEPVADPSAAKAIDPLQPLGTLGGSRPVSDDALREIWLKLRAKYPAEFSIPTSE